MAWLEFLALALVIAAGGYWLSRFGDVIAERTGLSGSWIGLILLSTVTSLPELVTGVSAVTVAHAPNLAVGDVLGSCVYNLLILAAVDLLHRGSPMFSSASLGHVLSANFGAVLLGLVGLNLLLAGHADGLSIGRVGVITPVMILANCAGSTLLTSIVRKRGFSTRGPAGRTNSIPLSFSTRAGVSVVLSVVGSLPSMETRSSPFANAVCSAAQSTCLLSIGRGA